MIRAALLSLALLLFATPAFATGMAESATDTGERTLNLMPLPEVPGLPDVRQSATSMDEATMKTARGLNPFLKIAPLVIGIPLGVAGISIVASVPIALAANDPFAAASMFNGGMGLMGGAFAATLTFDILARTLRLLLDAGPWQKRLGMLIAGSGLSIGGIVLAGVGAQQAITGAWPDGAVAGFLVGGATLFGVGMAIRIIDTVQTAWEDNDPVITMVPGRLQVKFAGVYAAPTQGGMTAGVALRW